MAIHRKTATPAKKVGKRSAAKRQPMTEADPIFARSGESREIPRPRTPTASSSRLLSRRSSSSFVQVDDQSKR